MWNIYWAICKPMFVEYKLYNGQLVKSFGYFSGDKSVVRCIAFKKLVIWQNLNLASQNVQLFVRVYCIL